MVKLVFRDGLVVTINDYSAASTNTQVSVVIPNLFSAFGAATMLNTNANKTVADGVILTLSVGGVAQPLAATTPMSVHRHLIEAATPVSLFDFITVTTCTFCANPAHDSIVT